MNSEMRIHIKNMVCKRCILAVDNLFREFGYEPVSVSLGRVELAREINAENFNQIRKRLNELGFEIIEDHKARIIEKIKNVVIEHVYKSDEELKFNFSKIIESELNMNYNYLSNLFTSAEGITIEKYIIYQKIERVKEYLVYNELTISEIAIKLGYSNSAHLSTQFKKVTGLTPSYFKEIGQNKRKTIDQVGA